MKNQFVVKKSVIAVALTLASSPFVLAQAQSADGQAMQKVVVTGSNIKRLASETASPVTVIRREEIQATGANTVRQILDTLTAFDSNVLKDDGSTNSFASGASGASMRGLGKGATLVLVNGRRVSNYAFADGAQQTFVNVDSIPADVIERVEVLKDGASAIYGSDAMAGVINIITRKTYQGVALSAKYEQGVSPQIGKQPTVGLIVGYGDLEKDRFNVFANLEGYQRKGYMLSDVLNEYPTWHKQYFSPAFGDASVYSFPGNLNQAAVKSGPGAHPAIREAVKSCPADRINSGGLCTNDMNPLNQRSDPADRLNFFSGARLKVNEDIQAFAEVSYSKTRTKYQAVPYAMAAGSPWTWFDGNKKASQSVQKPLLGVGNPANPYSYPVGIDYRFMDPGMDWSSPAEASQYRVMAGLEGTSGKWEWQVAAGRTGGDANSPGRVAHRDAMPAAVASGEYKLGGPNSVELLNRMFPETSMDAKLSQNFIDAKISGELMALPGGPLSIAVGGELRQEKMYIKSSDNIMNAEMIGRGSLWIEGDRKLSAMFVELNAPVLKNLELNGALRYDKAPGFSGHVSPKLGARFTVTPTLMIRGTVAGGFRAPNIPETLGKVGVTAFQNNTLDPKRCDTATQIRDILKGGNANDKSDATTAYNSGCLSSIPVMISSNPELKPETSTSFTLGLVAEPVKNISFAIDYFKIERKDEIDTRDTDYVLAREGQAGYADKIARNPVSDTDRRFADRANVLKPGANLSWGVGTLQSMLFSYENFGKTESSGVDVDITGRFGDSSTGKVTVGLTSTIGLTLRSWDIDANAYRPNKIGLRNAPRVVSVLSLAWSKGPWVAGTRVNYKSHTALNNDETDDSTWSQAGCQARLKPTDVPCDLGSDVRTDFNLAYTGFKNLRLSTNLNNAFDQQKPINLRDGYTLRPRTLKVAAEYTF